MDIYANHLQLRKNVRLILLIVMAAIGMSLVCICYYPGYLTQDSLDQLTQARSGTYTDWHPPLMAFVWRQVDKVIPGPFGMVGIFNILFWTGLVVAVHRCRLSLLSSCIALLAIGLYPPVFSQLGTVWKDVGFGASLMFACALLLAAQDHKSLSALLLGLVALYFGIGLRHNGIFAVLPLTIWAALIFLSIRPPLLNKVSYSAAIFFGGMTALVLVIGSSTLNNWLTHNTSTYPIQQILIHDLVAISIASDQNLLPSYLNPHENPFTIDELEKLYVPHNSTYLFTPNKTDRYLPLSSNRHEIIALEHSWLATIPYHLSSYFNHRWQAFCAEFGYGAFAVCNPYARTMHVIDDASANTHASNWVQDKLFSLHDLLKNQFLFRGYVYLLLIPLLTLSILISPLTSMNTKRAATAIALSGLCYAGAYFFIATTCDFRMHWWTILTACLLILLIFDQHTNMAAGTLRECEKTPC